MSSPILPDQNDRPSTVFVFGAGASYSAGVPLQSDLLPQLVEQRDPQLARSAVGMRIREFLTTNFSCTKQYPSLEEVFGFIEFFIQSDLALSREWGPHELWRIKNDLKKVIHYIISKSSRGSEDFAAFWTAIKAKDAEIGVITTNYDTLIDEAFDVIYPRYLIDYCLDFVNYRHPDTGEAFDWWIDPKKPMDLPGVGRSTRVKLVKLHGSLNWKYCPCCGQIALTPWQHHINLKEDTFESFIETQVNECPFDGTKLQSLIQPPTHLKQNTNYIFQRLYDEASYMVGNARQLIFVGYSFPEADVHIRAVVRRCFADEGRLIVINKSTSNKLKQRYVALSQNAEYHACAFEEFVRSNLFAEILCPSQPLQTKPRFVPRS
jgi:hypothetical protein